MENFNMAKSFTLIEILIVTSLIIVMSGTSLAIFSSYRDDKVLDNQVTLLKSTIEMAMSKAVAGDVSLCSDNTNAHVNGYTVLVDSTDITTLPGCDTNPTPIKSAIPQNISYVTPTFSLSFGNMNYQGETRVFPIKNKDTGKCKFVQISETGVVTSGNYTPCP